MRDYLVVLENAFCEQEHYGLGARSPQHAVDQARATMAWSNDLWTVTDVYVKVVEWK